ncbi:hypothetical protein [Kordia sp.]|uniref:hypothetical protein n=1 Tax=Kordia sp. TaxID=1965332 RepID=UPI003D6C2470
MKNYFLLLFIGIALVSCSNDDDNSPDTSTQIIGNWNWVKSSGGITNITHTPASTGNTQRLEITSTVFKSYFNNELVLEKDYSLETRESSINSQVYEMIILGDQPNLVVEIIDNRLFISGDFVDSSLNEYSRE